MEVVNLKNVLAADWPDEVPTEEIPEVLGELERAKAKLWARLNEPKGNGNAEEDRALKIAEAAKLMGCAVSWLYAHAEEMPFAFRQGRRSWRFSYLGIQRYIGRSPQAGRRGLDAGRGF